MKQANISIEDQCPHCGNTINDKPGLDFGSLTIGNGAEVYYDVHCKKCSQDFREYYKLIFDCHFIEGDEEK